MMVAYCLGVKDVVCFCFGRFEYMFFTELPKYNMDALLLFRGGRQAESAATPVCEAFFDVGAGHKTVCCSKRTTVKPNDRSVHVVDLFQRRGASGIFLPEFINFLLRYARPVRRECRVEDVMPTAAWRSKFIQFLMLFNKGVGAEGRCVCLCVSVSVCLGVIERGGGGVCTSSVSFRVTRLGDNNSIKMAHYPVSCEEVFSLIS